MNREVATPDEGKEHTEDQIAFAEGVKNILADGGKINVKTIRNMAKTSGLKIEITGNEKVDRENMRRLVAEILEI